ncbi:21478_t:CDS:1, partial [Gigaspora margarita]
STAIQTHSDISAVQVPSDVSSTIVQIPSGFALPLKTQSKR